MNGLPYYKRYPRDFIEGTIGLPFELKTTYAFVLDLIYMQGGDLPDDARYIAGLLGVSVRKWKSLRQGLIDAGKIQVNGEHLTNYRAVSELESLAKLSRKQSENASRPKKNKGLQKPRPSHTESDTDKKSSVSIETGGDPAAIVFGQVREMLVSSGRPDRQARSILGKWRKAHGDSAIIAAAGKAQREGAVDPVAFIEGVFRAERKRNPSEDAELAAQGIREIDIEDDSGNFSRGGDNRSADAREPADNVSSLFRDAPQETRPMPERDVQAERGGVELLALRT